MSDDISATLTAVEQLLNAPCTASAPTITIDAAESGSTLRFLIPIAAALGKTTRFVGRGRLAERPLRHYETILAPHGVSLAFPDDLEQSLPLDVSGRLRGGRFDVPGDISSQYLTGLLMALPLTGSAANIVLTSPLESKSYIDLTCQVMAHYGVDVFYEESSERYAHGAYRIAGNQMYGLPNEPTSEPMAIERDYSQAAFWLVAQALGQPIEIANLVRTACKVIALFWQLSIICVRIQGRRRISRTVPI